MNRFDALLAVLVLSTGLGGYAQARTSSPREVLIQRTVYQPFFEEKDEGDRPVGPLRMDAFPVTNAEFLAFVKLNPQWRKAKARKIFVSPSYLEHWKGDTQFDPKSANHPVVNVSWFSARAYCESQGKRLPTVAEWEAVADGRNPKTLELILQWYSRPSGSLSDVGQGDPNRFGVSDMHGLVWEWVEDFSSVIIVGDSRSSNDPNEARFCGSGSLKAKDPNEYATFMRFAFRSSLQAKSGTSGLGFRCVRDIGK